MYFPMPLASANVDKSQRLSITAATFSSANLDVPNNYADKMLMLVKYESVATVCKDCDGQRNMNISACSVYSSLAVVLMSGDND